MIRHKVFIDLVIKEMPVWRGLYLVGTPNWNSYTRIKTSPSEAIAKGMVAAFFKASSPR